MAIPGFRRLALSVVSSLLFVFLAAPSGEAQSLADLAKKEKARRAKIANPGKVLTEGDVTAKDGSVTEIEAAAPSTSPSPSPTPEGESAEEQRAAWKARADSARGAVTSAQKALEQREREAAAFRSDLTQVSAAEAQDPLRLQKREATIAAMHQQIEGLKASLAAARAGLAAFEDEARRAGVPAGWLR